MKQIIKDKDGKILKVKTVFEKPTKTQQQFKNETDINKIIAKYNQTGEFTHLKKNKGVYADLTFVSDYQTALNKVIEAQKSFSELNAQTRNRFGNDPKQLIDFLRDPKNREEAIKLGLIEAPPITPPPPANPQSTDTKV